MELSYRQSLVLEFIVDYLCAHGSCPDFQTLLDGMQESQWSLRSKLDTLARQDWIIPPRSPSDLIIPTKRVFLESWKIDPNKPNARLASASGKDAALQGEEITPAARPCGLPLAGRIAAGRPIEAFEQPGFISLADIVDRKDVHILEVNGNSMIEDHILDGDFVAVEKCSTVNDGEIAVALIKGYEATLKRLYREEGNIIRLQPANPAMDPIMVAAEDVAVQGRVVAVLRRF